MGTGYQDDFVEDSKHYWFFNTQKTDGTPITLAGTPSLEVYIDDNIVQDTAGLTLDVDVDGVTGLHRVTVDTSADVFYVTASDFGVVLAAGTVDGVSVVGSNVGSFSIENRYMVGTDGANTVVPRTAQQIRDSLKLAASGGAAAADSIDQWLEAIYDVWFTASAESTGMPIAAAGMRLKLELMISMNLYKVINTDAIAEIYNSLGVKIAEGVLSDIAGTFTKQKLS